MDESMSHEAIEAVKAGKAAGSGSGSMAELFGECRKERPACFLVTLDGTVAFHACSVTGPNIVGPASRTRWCR